MTRFSAVALGCMLMSTAQAGEPPSSCQGLLSDRDLYAAVNDAVVYTMVFNDGSRASSDKIFSDLGYWLERKLIWLENEPRLLTRLKKIISETDSTEMREQLTACYPNLDKFLHPEAARRAETAERAEAEKRAEATKQAESAKRTEATRQAEAAARQAWEVGAPARSQLEEAARQAWKAGAPARAAEAAKEAKSLKRAEEAARQAWEAEAPAIAEKQAEAAKRAEEAARQAREVQVRLEEAARQAWAAAAPARAAEAAKLAEAEKQARSAKQAEDTQRTEEAARHVREADAQARAQEERTRRQEEYILKAAYVDYTIVKRCHDKREWGYISEPQLTHAQTALSGVEQKIKKQNIDLDALQKHAYTLADGLLLRAESSEGHLPNPVEGLCNAALAELLRHRWWVVPEEAQK